MYLECLSGESWKQTNPGGNYSTNGYPTRGSSLTSPALVTSGVTAQGDGIIPVGDSPGFPGATIGGIIAAKHLLLVPYGVGSNTNTFSMQILGWRKTNLTGSQTGQGLWIPVAICTLAVTLGTNVEGLAYSELGSTNLFATSITMTGGPLGVTSAFTPTSEDFFTIAPTGTIGAAWAKVPTFGFRYIEVVFTTGGSATSCNCLWQKGSF
jgi:hypothetical protein